MSDAAETPDEPHALLKLRGLRVEFPLRDGRKLTAVDGVDLDIREGEVHGLVGESGSGKTALASAILRLIDQPGVIAGGMIWWLGRDLMESTEREIQDVRGRDIAMVFQNALASLNPALRIGAQMSAVLRYRRGLQKKDIPAEILRLLSIVRLPDGERIVASYPHELSAGMAQRVALALALASKPRLLIADEPTSALDVTIAAQLVELLRELRQEFKLSLLLISHDLGVVARLCDRVSVMYLGRVVETGPTIEVFQKPSHPYTEALLSAALSIAPGCIHTQQGSILRSGPPSAFEISRRECRFAPRCPQVFALCRQRDPMLVQLRELPEHWSACLLHQEIAAQY